MTCPVRLSLFLSLAVHLAIVARHSPYLAVPPTVETLHLENHFGTAK